MPKPYELATLTDFTGGLNLRADQFRLAANESPDLLNVDIDPRGGIEQRKGCSLWHATALGTISQLLTVRFETGTTIIARVGTALHAATTGAFGASFATQANSNDNDAITFKQTVSGTTYAYIQNGTDQPIRWDGTTVTRLAQTFNDDLANPNNGDMPIARFIEAWQERAWIAYTKESGTDYRNRVRFSHPGRPEDWRTNDYIDVGLDDGDQIVALAADGDRLLVFKRRHIYSITGYDPDSFVVQLVSSRLGALDMRSVCTSPYGVYFWNPEDGLYWLRPNGTALWLFDRLYPGVEDGTILASSNVSLAWADRRLWISLSWDGNRNIVTYDPTIGRNGAFVRHDLPMNQVISYIDASTDDGYPMGTYGGRAVKLNQLGTSTDDYDNSTRHIESYYRTAWIDLGTPGLKKRWGRLRSVVRSTDAATLRVDVYHDYDPSTERKTMSITTEDRSSAAVFDTAVFDTDVFGSPGTPYDIERNSSLGTSSSLQLALNGPTTNAAWALSALSVPYRMRRFR